MKTSEQPVSERSLTPGTQEYDARVLSTQPRRSVKISVLLHLFLCCYLW
jgi:hypothetical protein